MADEPRPNRPESGAYGEKADIQKLKESLPTSGGTPPTAPPQSTGVAGPPPQGSPVPIAGSATPTGRPPGSMTAPPGVPNVMMHDQPAGQPILPDAAAPTRDMSPSSQTLYILDVLSTSPDVSPETREWAEVTLDLMLGVTSRG